MLSFPIWMTVALRLIIYLNRKRNQTFSIELYPCTDSITANKNLKSKHIPHRHHQIQRCRITDQFITGKGEISHPTHLNIKISQ
ncbi:hypothetical protein LX69_02690 [Breznakibacter xylanolyticus]|uniref:Uncharacterized protein n=1 Tax=Breznakibacter xylanolyticus TaxID=990 RepID=A0A2W7N993_9BACT|nr:hypothetical protein LX69_02690 [Breznakibacter xylanolyticus]